MATFAEDKVDPSVANVMPNDFRSSNPLKVFVLDSPKTKERTSPDDAFVHPESKEVLVAVHVVPTHAQSVMADPDNESGSGLATVNALRTRQRTGDSASHDLAAIVNTITAKQRRENMNALSTCANDR